MNIYAVHLSDRALNRHFKLMTLASDFARQANLVVCSSPYERLRPNLSNYDATNGTENLPDPLRHALKQQKFSALAGYAICHRRAGKAAKRTRLHSTICQHARAIGFRGLSYFPLFKSRTPK